MRYFNILLVCLLTYKCWGAGDMGDNSSRTAYSTASTTASQTLIPRTPILTDENDPLCIADAFFKRGLYQEAFSHYSDPSLFNNKDALYRLGYIHEKGLVGEVNYEKAFSYYTHASLLYSPNACLKISDFYADGLYVPKNLYLSCLFDVKAAESGSVVGSHNAALHFLQGTYCPKDIDKAIHYMKYATQHHYREALAQMARFHMDGIIPECNYEMAFTYSLEAARRGSALGAYIQFRFYNERLTVKRDTDAEIYWLTYSAKKGFEIAIRILEKRSRFLAELHKKHFLSRPFSTSQAYALTLS